MEIVSQSLVIIDRHNYDGARCLRQALEVFSGPGIFLVIGMLGDKERARVAAELTVARVVVVTRPDNPRASNWGTGR